MVKIMENPIKMDDLGGPPLFLETPINEVNLHMIGFTSKMDSETFFENSNKTLQPHGT